MASLGFNINIDITIGGESLRYSKKRTLTVGSTKADFVTLVEDNDTKVTLWDSTASPITSFAALVIVVDPNGVYADNAAEAKLDIEVNGTTDGVAFTVRPECPLVLTSDDIGSDADNVDEVINQIIAKNTNADAVGDVEVRVIIFGN